jgi:regulator of nucleoside diphosphate kinase
MTVSHGIDRKLTKLDSIRLLKFIATGAAPQLAEVLDDAEVLPGPAIPADVVTMYAKFVVRDLATRQRQVRVICYPHDADPAKGYISVLSPAGLALIGLPTGGIGEWRGPSGAQGAARIEEILFQPEAAGDYLT